MGLRVLVCDDSKVMRSMESRALKMAGLAIERIDQAPHGKAAIECVEQAPYDLLLLDVNMPVMGGIDALRAIRARPESKDLLVVAITSEGDEERLGALGELGASIVRKPFTAETIVDGIIRALGGQSGLANDTDEHVATDF